MAQQRPSPGNGAPSPKATPPPGWESGVWTRIGQQPARSKGLAVAVVLAVLGAGLATALVLRHTRVSPPARIEARVEGALRSDGSAAPGRVWWLAFDGAELRVYRNGLRWGERCPGGSGCAGGLRQELRLPLEGPGEYRAAAFSPGAGGETGTLHDDVAQARTQGVAIALSDPLIVY